MAQRSFVGLRGVLHCRAVDQHRMPKVCRRQLLRKLQRLGRLALRLKPGGGGIESNAALQVEEHLPVVCQPVELHHEAQLLLQPCRGIRKSPQKGAPHVPQAHQEDVEGAPFWSEEDVVDHVQGPLLVFRPNNNGNIPLRRALSNAHNVDHLLSQGRRDPSHHSGGLHHSIPHNCNDGTSGGQGDTVNQPPPNVVLELLLDGLLRGHCGAGLHGHANGMLTGRLRDQDDVDLVPGQGSKQPRRNPRGPDHSRPFKEEKGDVGDRGDPANHVAVLEGPLAHDCTRALGQERGFDVQRDLVLDCRSHRRRVNHLCSKERQLHRLFEGQVGDPNHLVTQHPRVRGHHTVDIRPNNN
eukprot:RCo042011